MFREISTETEQDVAENALVDKFLAELKHLTNLTALNLCDNYFTTMPDELAHLTRLEFLDISINETLQVHRRSSCESSEIVYKEHHRHIPQTSHAARKHCFRVLIDS